MEKPVEAARGLGEWEHSLKVEPQEDIGNLGQLLALPLTVHVTPTTSWLSSACGAGSKILSSLAGLKRS
ncbi:hypothetical protein Y1Q_0024306 [Alligator mississippiensis]|uniref:Uncharacterized protein n=1 Tax=Alligator mississippiensis TaxID=8496 RepID=A0A151NII5_ALLMI|nr:hypothetical protein Y1Q_0024306 [Alligator mississippiensis]